MCDLEQRGFMGDGRVLGYLELGCLRAEQSVQLMVFSFFILVLYTPSSLTKRACVLVTWSNRGFMSRWKAFGARLFAFRARGCSIDGEKKRLKSKDKKSATGPEAFRSSWERE